MTHRSHGHRRNAGAARHGFATLRYTQAIAALALALIALIANAADAERDPVEGFWLGTTGTDKEKIDVGLEFHRDAAGKLRVKLTEPIMNYFGVDDPGEVRREGDRVIDEALFLDLTLKGDTLTGSYPGPRSPASLHRVDRLPAETPIPELPTGPAPLWQTRLNGQAYAAPIVADDVAYIGTTGGAFYAVDTKKGAIAWAFGAGAPIFGAAAVDGGAVYFACDNGFLYKIDRASGKETLALRSRRRRGAAHPAGSVGSFVGLAGRAAAHRGWRRLHRRRRRRFPRGRCGDRPAQMALRRERQDPQRRCDQRRRRDLRQRRPFHLRARSQDRLRALALRHQGRRRCDAGRVRRPHLHRQSRLWPLRHRGRFGQGALETILLGLVGRIDAGRARRRDLHRLVGPAPRQRDRSEGRPCDLAQRCLRMELGHAARHAGSHLRGRRRRHAVLPASCRELQHARPQDRQAARTLADRRHRRITSGASPDRRPRAAMRSSSRRSRDRFTRFRCSEPARNAHRSCDQDMAIRHRKTSRRAFRSR